MCKTYVCYFTFKALISLSLRLSALEFCNEITAQIAAGIQPIKVTCKIRQRIDVSILPLKKKETNGKNIAINVIVFLGCLKISYFFAFYLAMLLEILKCPCRKFPKCARQNLR